MQPSTSHRAAALQALFVTFLWSTSWVLIKIGLADIPALTFAGLRYCLAFGLLLVLFLQRGGAAEVRALPRRHLLGLAALGLLFYTITQGAQYVGLAYLPAVTANLLLSFSAVFVALLGLVLLSERPAPAQWAGIGLSILGALVYFYPVQVPAAQALGWVALIGGVLANAGSAVLGRSINRRRTLSSLGVTVVSMGVGAPLLLGAGVLAQGLPRIGLSGWLIVAWLAVVNTAFAFTLWNLTLRTLPASELSVINNSMMVQIPVLAVLFLGESLSGQEVLGLALVVVGIFLVQVGKRWVVGGKR